MGIARHDQTAESRLFEAYSWNHDVLTSEYPTLKELSGPDLMGIQLTAFEDTINDLRQRRATYNLALAHYAIAYAAQTERAEVYGGEDVEVAKEHVNKARGLLKGVAPDMILKVAHGHSDLAYLRTALDVTEDFRRPPPYQLFTSAVMPRRAYANFRGQAKTALRWYVRDSLPGSFGHIALGEGGRRVREKISTRIPLPAASSPLIPVIAEAEFLYHSDRALPGEVLQYRARRLAAAVFNLPRPVWFARVPKATFEVCREVSGILPRRERNKLNFYLQAHASH
ncbi:MAG TPA: hypothetical protein VJ836_00080 [Candidatus Saccharimonadales bacterium]|nr:hypothetical protein [Candidatus Saccharimonadales bacterium]